MELHYEYIEQIFKHLYSTFNTVRKEDVDDSVMEIAEEYLDKKLEFDNEHKLLTWLYLSSKNRLFDKLKKDRWFEQPVFKNEVEDNLIGHENNIMLNPGVATDDLLDLYSALDKLDTPSLEVIENHYIQGYSFAQIGKYRECPDSTMRKRHERALEKLRQIMEVQLR